MVDFEFKMHHKNLMIFEKKSSFSSFTSPNNGVIYSGQYWSKLETILSWNSVMSRFRGGAVEGRKWRKLGVSKTINREPVVT